MVRLLPFLEETVAYNSMAAVSNKFSYPAFAMTGGQKQNGTSRSGASLSGRWHEQCQPLVAAFQHHRPRPGTLPQLCGRVRLGLHSVHAVLQHQPGRSADEPHAVHSLAVITTNYKAMVATHLGCCRRPRHFPVAGPIANSRVLQRRDHSAREPAVEGDLDSVGGRRHIEDDSGRRIQGADLLILVRRHDRLDDGLRTRTGR